LLEAVLLRQHSPVQAGIEKSWIEGKPGTQEAKAAQLEEIAAG
jgi:hypothetical protein